MRRAFRNPTRSKIRNTRLRSQYLKEKSQNEHRTIHAIKAAAEQPKPAKAEDLNL